MSELLGAILTLLLFFLAGICTQLFNAWAIAYKRRGYITKKQLRKMTQAEFDNFKADLKENEPNLFQFIVDLSIKK